MRDRTPLSVEKLAEFRGGGWRQRGFFRPLFFCFSNSANFPPEDVPIHGILGHSRFERRIDDVLGIEFSENL